MRYALVILFLHCKVFSQTITFSKAIDFNVGLEFPFSVIETDSGYVLMGGAKLSRQRWVEWLCVY